jgi:hypothetical protein
VKRLKPLIFALAISAAAATAVFAQQAGGPPVFDMHRLYQFVGHLYNLDPDLLEAIATAESNNNPDAVSPKGAEGVMQLMPGTARQFKVEHPFDPVENVFGAARFLTELRAWSRLQAPFGEVDLPAMIAAYNAGPGAVQKYGGIPPYAETQAYVRKVLWLYLLGQSPPRPLRGAPHRGPRNQPSQRVSLSPVYSRASVKKVKPVSVFDQLAEIRRDREREQSRQMAQRSRLSKIADRDSSSGE